MTGEFADAVTPLVGNAGIRADHWAAANRDTVKAALVREGAVLLRGFDASDEQMSELVLETIDSELLDDAFWSTPRKGIKKKTFSATEMASNRSISLHSEMSYMPTFPRFVAFHALEVASEGGETTMCNLDVASTALADVIAPFAAHGVIYQRHYHKGIDIPWTTAFRTESRDEVAAIAAKAGMTMHWLDGDVLMTEHRAQGTVADEAGKPLWFNQTHVFHPATLGPARSQVEALLGADRMPRNALFGDRTPIPDATIAHVNAVFNQLTTKMSWQVGDVVVLDNMRWAHGRAPFKGSRRLHVAMARGQSDPRRTPLFG